MSACVTCAWSMPFVLPAAFGDNLLYVSRPRKQEQHRDVSLTASWTKELSPRLCPWLSRAGRKYACRSANRIHQSDRVVSRTFGPGEDRKPRARTLPTYSWGDVPLVGPNARPVPRDYGSRRSTSRPGHFLGRPAAMSCVTGVFCEAKLQTESQSLLLGQSQNILSHGEEEPPGTASSDKNKWTGHSLISSQS